MRASLPLTAERGRIRAAVAALCAMVALAVVAAAAPPSAHAAFALKACEGGSVQGEGSSFQRVAQAQFQLYFDSPFGCGEGAAITSPVTYVSDGSGCGIASIGGGGSSGKCSDFEITGEVAKGGYRDHKTRFGGSDAPMTREQEAAAEEASGLKPGVIHTLPIANGATAVIVHFPEGCELEEPGTGTAASGVGTINGNTTTGGVNDPAGKSTGDTFAEETLRVHIPAETLEKIWDGTPITWGELVNGHMTGAPTAPLEAEEGFTHCAEIPVRRLVRFDSSGTTYNFKAYLGLLPKVTPAGVWTKSPVEGTNTTWPLTTSSTGKPKAVPTKAGTNEIVNECNLTVSGPSRICTGSANGNPFVASAVAVTDGSIGYSDLATAREKGFTITKKAHDHAYWVPLQTINPEKPEGERVGTNYVEPTATPLSNIENGGPNGSNCTNADYRGIPTEPAGDPTLGNWSKAIATGSKDRTTYPNCALTYDFVWDDDAPVYGNTPEEESKARTVKDYFTFVESEGGQQSLTAADYGALSPEIISIARKGVEAIGWNKAAGAGGGGGGGTVTPPTTAPIVTTPGITPTTPPSNSFSIASGKIKGKSIVLSLVLPDAGQLQIKATGGGVTVSNVTASIGMGQGTVTLPISSAALKKLAKSKSKKLSVTITVTFTPTGGTAATQKKTLTITQASIAGKGKAKGKKKKGKKKG
jgi:ABC-type phosphate transport system substrate-binding protein